ncbi:MAG TPA: MerR family transcriptional regulator [Hanamia sp.]|nr:MerR family transcriptional regulator [Hanamia sp.]
MNQFSISQLEKFSGIKAHTIRMWEHRYNALKPNRSEGNTRYYDNNQLRRLLNIVSLSNQEYKVSELCAMPDKQLFKLAGKLKNETGNRTDEYFVSQLIAAGITYDETHFDKIFSHCLLIYGMKDTYLKVIYPVLVRTGLMWCTNTLPPASEHFISNLFRQKIFTAIDSLPITTNSLTSWVLFLPENEFHEIGLLFSHYLIRLSGKKVIYLGPNVPLNFLVEIQKDFLPQNILLFFVHNVSDAEVQKYLNELSSRFTGKKIFVAATQKLKDKLKLKNDIHFLSSVTDLEKELI